MPLYSVNDIRREKKFWKSFKSVFTTYNTLENDVKDFYGNLDIPLVCFVV